MDEIDKKFEFTGSLLNGYTSREYQCYSVHCLKEELDLALNTLSDMILYPKNNKFKSSLFLLFRMIFSRLSEQFQILIRERIPRKISG